MKFEEVSARLAGIPHMTQAQGREITRVILENRFRGILELGFRHGVSTCYMAAALDEMGGGHITTIDLESARAETPNIHDLLGDLGLSRHVTAYFEPTSYLWRLMKMLEEDPAPRFDFCYLDGAHNWFTDGFAFLLVDRLLLPGGLVILDDLDWSYAASPTLKDRDWVRNMPAEERSTAQVRKVYELLVKPHPDYAEFMEKDGWAYARKRAAPGGSAPEPPRREVIHETVRVGLGAALLRVLNRLSRGR